MGCDIHMYGERSDPEAGWTKFELPVSTCNECDGTGKAIDFTGKPEECWWCKGAGERVHRLYEGRCYDDFAVLADVRNGRGFAGFRTGSGFDPIDQPRGVPEDASPEYKAEVEKWDMDGHSHSFQTLKELLDYDWSKTTQHLGLVSSTVYYDWWKNKKKVGPPLTWCGDVSGGNASKVTNEQMEQLFEDGTIPAPTLPEDEKERDEAILSADFPIDGKLPGATYFTRIVWELTYKESAVNLWHHTIPALIKYATDNKLEYDQIRVVYFFDN